MPNQMAALVLAAERVAESALCTSVGGSTQAQTSAWNQLQLRGIRLPTTFSSKPEARLVAAAVHGLSTDNRSPSTPTLVATDTQTAAGVCCRSSRLPSSGGAGGENSRAKSPA